MKRTPIKKKNERFCACGCGRKVRVFNSVKDKYFDYNCKKRHSKKSVMSSDRKKELQFRINTIVKLIDKGHPCIAGRKDKNIQAGHYFSIGSNETLRFNLLNIWGQSKESNEFNSGEMSDYKKGLTSLYSEDVFNEIERLKSTPELKLFNFEVNQAIEKCDSIIKWLKKENRLFSIEERLSLRVKFNEEIGLY